MPQVLIVSHGLLLRRLVSLLLSDDRRGLSFAAQSRPHLRKRMTLGAFDQTCTLVVSNREGGGGGREEKR